MFYLFQQVLYCQFIALSDFQEIASDCYVGKEISPEHYKSILKNKHLAENRIHALYAGVESKPILIICATEAEYSRFCKSGAGSGCSIGTPWGKNYVIIGRFAVNVDVMSHEMSHIELLERVGWMKSWTEVPQWFNEGLAMTVDHRFVNATNFCEKYKMYRQEWLKLRSKGQPILNLQALSKVDGFISENADRNFMAYITSGMEVSGWLANNNNNLHTFLDKLKDGATFKNSYVFTDFTKTPCGK